MRCAESDGRIGDVARRGDPLIAVVIPAYKQSQYLADAILSAVHQSLRARTRVVVVNDGCPFPTTDFLGRFFRDAFPGEVYYLRKPNGGLGPARNDGIAFALDAWPSVRAIFPLDADNRLSSKTLERLWSALAAAPPDVGWAYQDLQSFGTDDTPYRVAHEFSAYRLCFQNYCDAGSLVRRELFEAGIRYYDAREIQQEGGYEDWELFVHGAMRGFRGMHVADTGFLYRKHGHSMLDDTQREHARLYDYIRSKHWAALSPNAFTLMEHRELPRFALVALDTGAVTCRTSLAADASDTCTVEAFFARINAWEEMPENEDPYIPPVILFSHAATLASLHASPIGTGLLVAVQHALQASECLTLHVAPNTDRHRIAFTDDDSAPRQEPTIIAMTSHGLRDLLRALEHPENCAKSASLPPDTAWTLALGKAFDDLLRADVPARSGDQSLIGALLGAAERAIGQRPTHQTPHTSHERATYLGSHTEFMYWRHVKERDTRFPDCVADGTPTNVFFVTPAITLGGVEQVVLNLARSLAHGDPARRVHLLLTDGLRIEASPADLAPFATISWLPPGSDADREAALRTMLSGADIVINAHSSPGYAVLPELKAEARLTYVSRLAVSEIDPLDIPYGFPITVPRHYESLIDAFVVPSALLARFCTNVGVPREKVAHIPNAPTVAPPSVDAAIRHAKRAGARRYGPDRPIRLLFAGRFDHQKGYDRVHAVARELARREFPFCLDIVGKPVLSPPMERLELPEIRYLPPAIERDALARHYREADIFLLPSRWEGVPLAMLEAMAFGMLVLMTDVGATREAIEHGTTGILFDSAQPEAHLIAAICDAIADIAATPGDFTAMRVAACTRAMAYTWGDAARLLMASLAGAMVSR